MLFARASAINNFMSNIKHEFFESHLLKQKTKNMFSVFQFVSTEINC